MQISRIENSKLFLNHPHKYLQSVAAALFIQKIKMKKQFHILLEKVLILNRLFQIALQGPLLRILHIKLTNNGITVRAN